jgi:hypothetical protein
MKHDRVPSKSGPRVYRCSCGASFKHRMSFDLHRNVYPTLCKTRAFKDGRAPRRDPTPAELRQHYAQPVRPEVFGGFEDARTAWAARLNK